MWFDGVRQPNTLYVASVSRGKDSTAMLRAIELLGFPLDAIVAVDIWFDDETPAELPPMVAFKDEWDKKCLERFGVPVTRVCAMTTPDKKIGGGRTRLHTEIASTEKLNTGKCETESNIVMGSENIIVVSHVEQEHGVIQGSKLSRSEKLTYCDVFYRQISPKSAKARGESLKFTGGGATRGFPLQNRSWCNSALKRDATKNIRLPDAERKLVYRTQNPDEQCMVFRQDTRGIGAIQSSKGIYSTDRLFSDKPCGTKGEKINIVRYIGIAADEPLRVERHMKAEDKVLPLVQIGWDEDLCGLIATYMDMLSPTYSNSFRDGCWFCHNQSIGQLRMLRKNYPELWAKLMKIDLDSPVTFHADGRTVHDFDKRFELEDMKLVPADRTFRWDMLDGDLQMSLF